MLYRNTSHRHEADMCPPIDRLTILLGPQWREYIQTLPPARRLWPVGTVKVGNQLEGALLFDMKAQRYVLVDTAGAWFELDETKVRAALRCAEEAQLKAPDPGTALD